MTFRRPEITPAADRERAQINPAPDVGLCMAQQSVESLANELTLHFAVKWQLLEYVMDQLISQRQDRGLSHLCRARHFSSDFRPGFERVLRVW